MGVRGRHREHWGIFTGEGQGDNIKGRKPSDTGYCFSFFTELRELDPKAEDSIHFGHRTGGITLEMT